MNAPRLLIPVLAALILTGGCLTAEKIVTAEAHVTAPSLATFVNEVFIREQSIFPTPADDESWQKEPCFLSSRYDDGDDRSGLLWFLMEHFDIPSSPRARAILDADRQLLRAGLSPGGEINGLRHRAILTLRNERLAASWIERKLPVADTERIAFAMLFSPDECSRHQAFTLFRHYLIRSLEPIDPFTEGLKAVLEAEAPFLTVYRKMPLLPMPSHAHSFEQARAQLDADAVHQREEDYLARYRNQSPERSGLGSFFEEPVTLELIAALNTFHRAQCESPDFRLSGEDLARVIHHMLTDPAQSVRETAFSAFQQEVLRGATAEEIIPLVEKTARERIIFEPGLAPYRGRNYGVPKTDSIDVF